MTVGCVRSLKMGFCENNERLMMQHAASSKIQAAIAHAGEHRHQTYTYAHNYAERSN
jgi:hypothetical protein